MLFVQALILQKAYHVISSLGTGIKSAGTLTSTLARAIPSHSAAGPQPKNVLMRA